MKTRLPSLDGLRALAISLLVIGHLDGTGHFPKGFVMHSGRLGIQIFLVYFGFLSTTLLATQQAENGHIDLLDLYRRRAYRILPAALFFIAVGTALDHKYLNPKQVISAFAFLSNFVPSPPVFGNLWSLALEVQFFLLWSVLLAFWFGQHRKLAWVGLLAPIALRVMFYFLGWRELLFAYFPTAMDSVAAGALLASYWDSLAEFDSVLLSPYFVVVPVSVIALELMAHSRLPILREGHDTFGLTLMNVSIALCLYNAVKRCWKILNLKPVVWLGCLSYSLFLWQQLFIDRENHAWWSAFPQNLVLSLLLAIFSYYVIETPFLSLAKRPNSVPEPSLPEQAASPDFNL